MAYPGWYDYLTDEQRQGAYDINASVKSVPTSIADRPIWYRTALDKKEPSPGRRMRVFSRLVEVSSNFRTVRISSNSLVLAKFETEPTYGETLARIEGDPELREKFNGMALRTAGYSIGDGGPSPVYSAVPADYIWEKARRDPELHGALQDLARAVVTDLTEACAAFDNPDLYYPGVDEGIEPVTDEQVELVTWAVMRELKREPRRTLPSAPIDQLPWNIRRAFAERRRLRFQQWGIGRVQWETNSWSLWDVPEDVDWVPVWVTS